ncbi:MAG: chorismate synthase [Actinomycetia bacterium]|nr:chorismate synthase [Actinomycetes bacterium]
MNTWGQALRLSIFGESHGPAIGIVVDGLPAGEAIDLTAVEQEMARRAPGQSAFSTARREADQVEVLSGLLQGRTTGAPILGLIRNTDAHSSDYDSRLRPGHADWTALLKYHGLADMRGGGHFSGRLTAPLVFAGSLAKQLLGRQGITVYARIARIGQVVDQALPYEAVAWAEVSQKGFPAAAEAAMAAEVKQAKSDGDSVGGEVEAVAFGLPGGLGEPFFGSMESCIASMLFSIPAVKGVEFGDGFRLAQMRGSLANDQLTLAAGQTVLIKRPSAEPASEPQVDEAASRATPQDIRALSNHNGGILGGISNGMPLVVRVAIKPTPSIASEQQTVDGAELRPVKLCIHGRHDPCIVVRAVPVVEAALALAVLDRWLVAQPQLLPQTGEAGNDEARR